MSRISALRYAEFFREKQNDNSRHDGTRVTNPKSISRNIGITDNSKYNIPVVSK